MPDLTTTLLALRPAIDAELSATATPTVGDFLHRTLRPVLKLQNELLLLVVADFVREHHIPFQAAGAAERERLVAELLTLRYTIIGIISGMFTPAETAFYRQHRAELNRRLLELATQRVQSQVATVAEHVASAGAAT
jgi:hypothetical protein